MMRNLAILLVSSLLVTAANAATTYYVSPSGSGTTCSDGTPCSITYAESVAVAGDTIILKDGTYTGSYVFDQDGTEADRIYVKAQNYGGATFTGFPDITGDYQVWEGAVHQKTEWYGKYSIVTNSIASPSTSQFAMGFLGSNFLLTHSVFTNFSLNAQGGMLTSSGVTNGVIEYNVFTGNQGRDLIRPDGEYIYIRYNMFSNIISGPQAGHDDHTDILQTFSKSATTRSRNIHFHSNYLTNSFAQFMVIKNPHGSPSISNWYIYNNILHNSYADAFVYIPDVYFDNNTIINMDDANGMWKFRGGSNGTGNGIIRNNILLHISGNEDVTVDGSIFESKDGGSYWETHNIYTQPDDTGFINITPGTGSYNGGYSIATIIPNYAAGDYSIDTNSVAYQGATNLSSVYFDYDYNGDVRPATWSMGALTPEPGTSDTTAPTISGVSVDVTDTTATVSFTTDELAVSGLEWGTTASYGNTETNTLAVTSHALVISGLSASTTYHYKIYATDEAGNAATPTSDATFATTGSTPAVLGYDQEAVVEFITPTNTSLTATFSITNTIASGDNLTWTVYTSAPFSIVAPTNGTLVATASTNITVQYDPTSVGLDSGVATITGGGGGTVPLNGIAFMVQPIGAIQPTNATIINRGTDFLISGDAIYSEFEALNLNDCPRAIIGFSVPQAGTYHVRAYVTAESDAKNSVFLEANAVPTSTSEDVWDVVDLTSGYELRQVNVRGSGTPSVPEFRPNVFTFPAGNNYIEIRGREKEMYIQSIFIDRQTPATGSATVGGDLRVGF